MRNAYRLFPALFFLCTSPVSATDNLGDLARAFDRVQTTAARLVERQVVPNFRVMEIDIDSVAWRDELFINAPTIENGELVIPKGPGWGVEVNEAAVRAHPPRA